MYEAGLGDCRSRSVGEIDGFFSSIASFVGGAVQTLAKPVLTVAGGAVGTFIAPGAGTALGAGLGSKLGSALSGGGGGDAPAPSSAPTAARITSAPRRPVAPRGRVIKMSSSSSVASRRRSSSATAPKGLTTGAKVAIAAGGVGALGAVTYLAWHALR